jgi:ABC transport system ATP-binding/permease protein
MKIVLAEERGGQKVSEETYQQPIIKIGRDAGECQIVFDNQQYPMVSRRHAELSFRGNQWFVADLGSSYGTYLDNQKIVQPQPVRLGSLLQFGTDGPVLRVVWLEASAAGSQRLQPQPQPAAVSQQTPVYATPPPQIEQHQQQSSPPPSSPQFPNRAQQQSVGGGGGANEAPQLIFVGTSRLEPYRITKDNFWLGRDPSCDIVMEAGAVMVSRRHAQISRQNGGFIVTDNGSFNGTLVNEQRISAPTPVYHGDEIQLGHGGPVLRFNAPGQIAPKGFDLAAGQRVVAAGQQAVLQDLPESPGSKTMVFRGGAVSQQMASASAEAAAQPQLLMQLAFGGKSELTVGRDERNDISLDGLQISNRHARLLQSGAAGVVIEDLNSTNGVYVNGQKISRQAITPSDSVQIGSFVIRVDAAGNIGVFDTRAKTRIDSVNITKEVKNRAGGGTIKLLDDVSLTIMPNEFVGLLGPSGAGKSTFMDALNGMRPASGGSVLINNLDLYQNLDALKQSIGYVPQDDIIHRELTVYRTLYYVAKLRLSRDVSRKEIDQIVNEVMDVTGLAERRDVPINQLSGGQRKRVSIAVELITKPSVIYLDEPTSGLDPATEEKIMVLFRQIAESGRTVILTTHAMENVKLFDKIVLLMRGKLVFYGKPQEALDHVGAKSFKELYDKLEEPIEQRLKASPGASKHQVTEQVAEEWKQKFTKTPQYKKNVYEPLRQIGQVQHHNIQQKRRLGLFGAIRQWMTLSRRYWEVLVRDKFNLFILFIQAPIVAFLTFLVMDADQPRDFVYFVLSLVSVWFGTSVAAREIIRERPVYNRERMVNLGLLPYVGSKLFILGIIVGIQCLLLFLPLKFFDVIRLMPMPGELGGIPQFWTMLLTAGVGIALGLFISATVKTSEMATSLVPLILIPQILFSGLVGVPTGVSKVAGLIMPATWSFDTMKRFSSLDTLKGKDDGADPSGKAGGIGYYKFVEQENDKLIADARRKIDDYKTKSEQKMKDYEKEMKDDLAMGQRPGEMPKLDAAPTIDDPLKISKNLSGYVNFLHPWMNEVLNQIVLMIMFFMLVIGTLIVLRMQDIA